MAAVGVITASILAFRPSPPNKVTTRSQRAEETECPHHFTSLLPTHTAELLISHSSREKGQAVKSSTQQNSFYIFILYLPCSVYHNSLYSFLKYFLLQQGSFDTALFFRTHALAPFRLPAQTDTGHLGSENISWAEAAFQTLIKKPD